MGKDLGIPVTDHGNDLVSFGSFEADLRAGELWRNGSKVRLQEQPFQVLTVLLEKSGEVVTREELRNRLWPADTFVDFDHGLNAAVKRLRDALGDSAENPRFVEPLARRGYRFVAPVAGRPNGTGLDTKAESVPARSARRHFIRIFAVLAVLLMGTGAGWLAARRLNPPVRVSEQRLTANPSDDPVLKAVISPDGKYLAFADRTGLFLRIIAREKPIPYPCQTDPGPGRQAGFPTEATCWRRYSVPLAKRRQACGAFPFWAAVPASSWTTPTLARFPPMVLRSPL